MIILDLETDGLLPECTTIHCAVAYDTVGKSILKFYKGALVPLSEATDTLPLSDLPVYLDKCARGSGICCHNGIGFDLKVLKKVLNYKYTGKYFDTLLLSRILFPDLDNAHYLNGDGADQGVKNPHSVESWGLRFGHPKVKHEDWSKFSPEMLHRCVEDTKIQGGLWEHLVETMKSFTVRDSRTANKWQPIIDMEQETWRIMEEQADRGWEFDLEKAYSLCDALSLTCTQTEDKLVPRLPPKVRQLTKTESGATKAFVAGGGYTSSTLKWFAKDSLGDVKGDFCRVRFEDFNIGSSDQVKNYLLKHGWEPKEYNFKKDKHNKPVRDEHRQLIKTSPKSPKTSEEWALISDKLGNPDIALLAEYNKASHRLSQIKGLISATRSDHRIEARANTCSTNTARMAHRIVVNIPTADPSVYYGKELRSLFRAGPGNVLVGCDACALEARCEAHYVYAFDKAQAELLIGGDIHSINAEVFKCDRNTAKTAKYALLYGCGPEKIASILELPLKQAKMRLEGYWEVNSACRELINTLEEEYAEYGYIIAIDGRPLTIRYKHALLNTLLQSCGSIAMKKALVLFDHHQRRLGFESDMVGNFHDEFQIECRDEAATSVDDGVINHLRYGDMIGRIAVNSIRQAGRDLMLNVPLEAEYKLGKDWSQTH